MRRFYAILALIPVLASCGIKDVPEPGIPKGKAVEVLSSLTGAPFDTRTGGYTRVEGDNWSAADRIGVFMYSSVITQENVMAHNRLYTNKDGSNRFTADATEKIYLEEEDGTVGFFAYYPYDAALGEDMKVKVDVSDQSEQGKLDLIYGVTGPVYDANTLPVDLNFSHQLVKIVFNIENLTHATVTSLEVRIKDMPYEGTFLLTEASFVAGVATTDIPFKTSVGNSAVTAEAIMLPVGDVAGKEVVFIVNGKDEVKWTVPAGTNWAAGEKYPYKVKLSDSGVGVGPNYGWFETPAISNIPNTVFISHGLPEQEYSHLRNYSLLYDTKYMFAYWVAYPMCSFYREPIGNDYTGNWIYDSNVPSAWQPNVLSNSWPASNYDRGHQIPSADRRYSREVNRTTYYTTNQTAQNATLNRTTWQYLEGAIRTWMTQCDTIYVVTGAMITTPDDSEVEYTIDNSNKEVAVPKYYYKALAKYSIQTDEYHTIAFKMDNEPATGVYMDYTLTVKELEEITGFTFFPNLSDNVKGTITSGQWN